MVANGGFVSSRERQRGRLDMGRWPMAAGSEKGNCIPLQTPLKGSSRNTFVELNRCAVGGSSVIGWRSDQRD